MLVLVLVLVLVLGVPMMSCSTDPTPDFAGRERRVRLLHATSESLGPFSLARAFAEGNQWVFAQL